MAGNTAMTNVLCNIQLYIYIYIHTALALIKISDGTSTVVPDGRYSIHGAASVADALGTVTDAYRTHRSGETHTKCYANADERKIAPARSRERITPIRG